MFVIVLAVALLSGAPSARADRLDRRRDGVPRLDRVFLVVLENRNVDDVIGHPLAPHLTALAAVGNLATNYHGVWNPSLPNYLALITGDWIARDVIRQATVGVTVNDSPANAIDLPEAVPTVHRWRVEGPSLASQLVAAGKDWRAYLQGLPVAGTRAANWPGDEATGSLYAVKHNPFAYLASVQDSPSEQQKQVPLEQFFGDLGAGTVPALSFIVPDQCRDMHGLDAPLAPCTYSDDVIARGDDMVFWLVRAITGSRVWQDGHNALIVTFDEGYGPPGCGYTATEATRPPAECYNPANFHDPLVLIVVTNDGVRGVRDDRRHTHFSLLRTLEAAFGLSYLGHAADATTETLAPLLAHRRGV
jgi:phosphatidylinositol-3-phosphatase